MINLLPTPPLTSGHHLLHNLLSIKWGGTPESLRSVSNLSILIDSQNQHQNKKNNYRLHQKTTHNHIYWPNGLWKNSPCLRIDRTNILTTLSLSAQHFDGITHFMPRTGSKMMIRFVL